jgi:acyl carrier protein
MLTGSPVNERIRAFVFEKFPLARKRGVRDSDELLESGIVDSLGILDLVAFLESEFGLGVTDEELLPENFRSIEQVARFAERKQKESGAPQS